MLQNQRSFQYDNSNNNRNRVATTTKEALPCIGDEGAGEYRDRTSRENWCIHR